MRNMREDIILIFVILMLVVSVGCGKGPVEKRTVIRFFNPQGLPEEIEIMHEIAGKFEEDNPDIKVKIESGGRPDKVLVEMAGGSPPDVYLAWTEIAPVAAKNALLELDEYVQKYQLDLDEYFSFAVDFSTYNGKLYSLPVNMHIPVVFYNKDMFERSGIPYPDGSWAWDDYYRIAKELTRDFDGNGRRDQFGTHLASLNPWLLPNRGYVIDIRNKSVNIRSKEAIETLEFAYKLHRDCCPTLSEMKTFGGVGEVDPFRAGRLGMLMQTAAYVSIFSEIKDFRWDIVPLPVPPHGQRINIVSGDYLAIPKGAKHPEEAFRFVKYYCGKEGMEILASHKRFILSYKQAAYKSFVPPPENMNCLRSIIEEPYAFDLLHGQADTGWYEIIDSFYRGWQLILLGETDFDEGINRMEKEMNRQLKQTFGQD